MEKRWIVLRPGGLKRCAAEPRAPDELAFLTVPPYHSKLNCSILAISHREPGRDLRSESLEQEGNIRIYKEAKS